MGGRLTAYQIRRSTALDAQRAIAAIPIALSPLAVQQAIVAELEAEAAAVEQARGLAERMAGRIAAAVGRVWGSQ